MVLFVMKLLLGAIKFQRYGSFLRKTECVNEIIEGREYCDCDIDISNCIFMRSFGYNGDGGVIYVVGENYTMSISDSMFFNVSSLTANGGAIYFDSATSKLYRICCSSCSAFSAGHFGFIQASKTNELELLSILLCAPNNIGFSSVRMITGDQKILSTNLSLNYAERVSGIGIISPSSYVCSYCTFCDNHVTQYICIYYYPNSGSMYYSNIIQNNSPSYGVIRINGGAPKFLYCIFDMNKDALFCVQTGSLTIAHCFIFHEGKLTTSNAVSMGQNNSLVKFQTYELRFFMSHYCNADFPINTNQKTQIIHQNSYQKKGILLLTWFCLISYNF